jgi:hypothetical protein
MTHGAYLTDAKRAAAVVRDRFRRRGEREARDILKAAGLEREPLARLVARQIGRLEAKVARLQEHHERRGHFDRAGLLKASVSVEARFIGDLLGEARRLFEQLQARGAADPANGDIEFKVRASAPMQPYEVDPSAEVDAASHALATTSPGGATSLPGEPSGADGEESRALGAPARPPRPVAPRSAPSSAPVAEPPSGDPLGMGWIPWRSR